MSKVDMVKEQWENLLTWDEAVKEAKDKVRFIHNSQLDIGRLASKVCIKCKGGRAYKGQNTITKFAREIGVNKKTLFEWVRLYETVVAKTPIANKESFSRNDFKAARKALANKSYREKNGIKVNNYSLNRIVKTEERNVSVQNVANQAFQALKHMKTLKKKIDAQGIKDIDRGVKAELKILCTQILSRLNGE